jgi:hypothetical protein
MCNAEAEAVRALSAAVAQIGLSLRESQGPVAELGALLSRLAENPQLQAEVFQGVHHLQFYDRMVQHLTHLEDYLIGIANELQSAQLQEPSRELWDSLHAKLRKRLISDEQRGLLDLYLRPEVATRVAATARPADYSPPGSFEMF